MYEREHCDFCLYVITPLMTGVYSIAEVTDDSNKRPEKTLFCVLHEDNNKKFTGAQLKSYFNIQNIVFSGRLLLSSTTSAMEYTPVILGVITYKQ